MNPENSPIPESDNTNLDNLESIEPSQQQDDLKTEVNSDAIKDIWATETDVVTESSTQGESEPMTNDESEPEPESKEVPLEESSDEPELFVDSWLDETEPTLEDTTAESVTTPQADLEQLEQQKAQLQQEIADLKAEKAQILAQQAREIQQSLVSLVEEGTEELKKRKTALRIEIDKLERRQERINQEMRSNFAGSSKELAIRVQGFKEYLVGSLQGLVAAAEKLELAQVESGTARSRESIRNRDRDRDRDRENPRREERQRSRRSRDDRPRARNNGDRRASTQFSEPTFADQSRRIRQLLDQYRNNPDYYGSPWQLRRTFEQNQAQKVQEWFFGQGGRGTIDSMGSRLQNILVASAAISILHNLYGDRCRVLVLTDTPENLGEWRRGLQDCLGISRNNFGANRGITLFDAPEVLVQRAERLISDKLLPVIIIDETEELLNPSVLKFPVWMAFASSNRSTSSSYLY